MCLQPVSQFYFEYSQILLHHWSIFSQQENNRQKFQLRFFFFVINFFKRKKNFLQIKKEKIFSLNFFLNKNSQKLLIIFKTCPRHWALSCLAEYAARKFCESQRENENWVENFLLNFSENFFFSKFLWVCHFLASLYSGLLICAKINLFRVAWPTLLIVMIFKIFSFYFDSFCAFLSFL